MARTRAGSSKPSRPRKPARARGKPRPDWRAKFLKELARGGLVLPACDIAGVSKSTVYELRKSDPEFAAAWDDALERSADVLEAEARRRAIEGVLKPICRGGELVGTERVYSDSLLVVLLRGRRPEIYSERHKLDAKVDNNHGLMPLTPSQLAALNAVYGPEVPTIENELKAIRAPGESIEDTES